MPELPEVETVRRLLERTVVGKTISSIEVYRNANIDSDFDEFHALLQGKTIVEVLRKGKVLGFNFDNQYVVTSHLRMEGKYFYNDCHEERSKHDILCFAFTDGSELVYNDVRKFGHLCLFPYDRYLHESDFAKLGPEPFDIDPKQFHRCLKRRSGNIKKALMDQTLISGIGNIYCDETLFASKLHPLTPARSISLAKAKEIIEHAKRILNDAIEEGGSTIRSYHPGKGIDGLMQSKLLVYDKPGTPCPRCGFPLDKIFVDQRGSTYCPKCQRNPLSPFVVGVTGPIHSGKSTVSKYLQSKGFKLFDADNVAHNAYLDAGVKEQIIALLGPKSYQKKKPNTAYIRQIISANQHLIKILNAIIHPYVTQQAVDFIAKQKPSANIVLDVPLLFQSHMDELCQTTILVLSGDDHRRERLLNEGRNADALLSINKGYPVDSIKKKARFFLYNDSCLDDLYSTIDSWHLI
ncbi:MAG: DNA-formamidopyrimidine glycosylase [Bacilli bacterium]|nr:DNA-formamidopyrimidine glycosylase [Bacilli bacterium]